MTCLLELARRCLRVRLRIRDGSTTSQRKHASRWIERDGNSALVDESGLVSNAKVNVKSTLDGCESHSPRFRLADDFFRDAAFDVSQSEIASGVAEGQALVIQAKQMQNRGVEVVRMHRIFDRFVAKLVRRAISNA